MWGEQFVGNNKQFCESGKNGNLFRLVFGIISIVEWLWNYLSGKKNVFKFNFGDDNCQCTLLFMALM